MTEDIDFYDLLEQFTKDKNEAILIGRAFERAYKNLPKNPISREKWMKQLGIFREGYKLGKHIMAIQLSSEVGKKKTLELIGKML